MAATTSYRLNAPDVIAETIDGETVVVNLTTGAYYSLEGSGAEVLAALVAGHTPDGIARELAGRYPDDAREIDSTVAQLVAELQTEGIIVETSPNEPQPRAEHHGLAADGATFVAPRLHKFTDMQEIILLDPVHEVDQRGWPHVADSAA